MRSFLDEWNLGALLTCILTLFGIWLPYSLADRLTKKHKPYTLWSVATVIVCGGFILFHTLSSAVTATKPVGLALTELTPAKAVITPLSLTSAYQGLILEPTPSIAPGADATNISASIETVVFEDKRMEKAVKSYLGMDEDAPIAAPDADKVQKLVITIGNIESISGIEKFTNLKTLVIDECFGKPVSARADFFKSVAEGKKHVNAIKDFTPLLQLKQLTSLIIFCNTYTDLETIGKITSLEQLRISGQYIGYETGDVIEDKNADVDIDVCSLLFLKDLENLKELDISRNYVRDFSVLENLRNLEKVNVAHNGTKAKPPVFATLGSLYSRTERKADWALNQDDLVQ